MYVQCPGCGHVLGKTHHTKCSGNNKRGIGTFDINTKAATGAFYSCGIIIILCHRGPGGSMS